MAYAGDKRPKEAWDLLNSKPTAQLVDVRTRPEWAFVGIPDLSSIGKQAMLLSWQTFPCMRSNPEFGDADQEGGAGDRYAVALHLPQRRAVARGGRSDDRAGLQRMLQRQRRLRRRPR